MGMSVTASANTPVTQASVAAPAGVPVSNMPPSTAPTDTVTLSDQAQQTLATTTASASTSATASAAAVGKYDAQFTSLAAIITDTSGQYFQEQQLQAYNAFTTLNSNAGVDSNGYGQGATKAQMDAVTGSAIGAQSRSLQTQMAEAMSAGMTADSNGGAQKAASSFYNSLSSFEQNIVFQSANMKLPNQPQLFSDAAQYGGFLASPSGTVPPPTTTSPASPSSQNDPVAGLVQSVLTLFNAVPLAATTAPSASSAASPSWSSQQVTDALTALNDTSGKTSVVDQISAYDLMTKMVSNGTNFDPSNTANNNAVDIATAFQTSAFAQHAQSLADQMFAYNNQPGVSVSEAGQRKLDYFNLLSSDDQQISVATMGAAAVAQGQQPVYSSAQAYTANLQASINVNRALESAYANPTYAAGMSANMPSQNVDANTAQQMALQKQANAAGDNATVALVQLQQSNLRGDAYTAAANAYFAEYGPPPAATDAQKAEDTAPAPTVPTTKIDASAIRAGYQDLTILNDSSGNVSAADMVAAWKQTRADIAKAGGPSNLSQISLDVNSWNSVASVKLANADDAYDRATWAGHYGSEVSAVQNDISAFKGLSSDDQVIIAATRTMPGYATTPDGYLAYLTDGLKNAAQGDAINAASRAGNTALYQALIANLVDYTDKSSSAASSGAATAAPGNANLPDTQNGVTAPVDSKTMMAQAILKLFTGATTKRSDQLESTAIDAKTSGAETSLEAIITSFQDEKSKGTAFAASPKSAPSLGGMLSQSV